MTLIYSFHSATNKWRLKVLTMFHLTLVFLMACRLSTAFCVMFGLRPPSFLQRLKLPRAQTWEYVWLFSFMASVMGLVAIRRNKIFLMKHYCLGMITFGVIPILYAFYDLSDDMLAYYDTRKATLLFLGFPVVVLWAMFLTIAIQVHGFGIFFAYQLIRAWRVRTVQKKAK